MSTNNINNYPTMNLGIVKMNNKEYYAILHYYDDDGSSLITNEIWKVSQLCNSYFQEVINQAEQSDNDNLSEATIQIVNNKGFIDQNNKICAHETLQTTELWQKFLTLLSSPQLFQEEGPRVELIDKNKISWNINNLKQILNKFQSNESNKELVNLTEEEKGILKIMGCCNLSKGQSDLKEITTLQTALDIALEDSLK